MTVHTDGTYRVHHEATKSPRTPRGFVVTLQWQLAQHERTPPGSLRTAFVFRLLRSPYGNRFSSTRRFCARPSVVVFGATGWSGP